LEQCIKIQRPNLKRVLKELKRKRLVLEEKGAIELTRGSEEKPKHSPSKVEIK